MSLNKIGNPLAAIIDFAWASGADLFWVNNAKDELKRLLDKSLELENLKKSLDNPLAWAKTNSSGDLFDLRLQNNPYFDQNLVVPLYRCPNDTKK